MPSLYHHPQLWDRLKDSGVISRYADTLRGKIEHVITVEASTSQDGFPLHVLSLQLLADSGVVLASTMLAGYPFSQLKLAEADAVVVAAKFLIRARRADPNVGWQWIADPDGPAVIRSAAELELRV